MVHETSYFPASNEMKLFFQRWKPEKAAKATIAIVHGIGDHSGRYKNVVDYFVPLNFNIYAFDHRGHGQSPGKRGHVNKWDEFRQDVQYFIELVGKEQPGLPLFILGHSLGGLVTLNYVLHNPQDVSAVIASSPALAEPGLSKILVLLSKVMSSIWPSFTVDTGLDPNSISRDPAVIKAYQNDPLVHGKASARLGTEFSATMDWTLNHASQFKLPLLIIHGSEDRLVPPSGSQTFYDQVQHEDKKLVIYEGGYHESFNDIEKEKVLKDVENWINAHL